MNDITWNDFKIYLAVDRKHSQKPQAVQADRSRFLKVQKWFVSHGVEFTRQNFNLMINEMMQNGSANSTMNNMVKIAKDIARYVQVDGFLDYTYFREAKKIPKDVLTVEDIDKLAHVEMPYTKNKDFINQRQKGLILLMGTVGCRIDEALSLTWEDVGTTAKYGTVTYRNTKNGDDRTNVLGRQVYEAIMLLPRVGETIFCSYRGKKLESREVNEDLKNRAKYVGIEKNVYCHLFRSSVVTEYLQDAMELSDVSDIVGHKDPKTTMRYKHANLDHYHQAMLVHPLLANEMDWNLQTKRVQEGLAKLIASRYPSSVEVGEKEIVIKITNPGS